jgi:hypothetical protein
MQLDLELSPKSSISFHINLSLLKNIDHKNGIYRNVQGRQSLGIFGRLKMALKG